MVNGLMIPFYTMTYRQYYCQQFITATRLLGDKGLFKYFNIGVTECCLIQYGTMFYFALQSDGNGTAKDLIDLQKTLGLPFALTVTKGWIFCNATAYLSLCMNITHMYTAY